MEAAQAMSGSILLPQTGNPSLKKARKSLIRLSRFQREGEDPSGCTAAVPRLGSRLQPLSSLPSWAVDPALAKSVESLVRGFALCF